MRMIIFFDLPSVTPNDKREYLRFRKTLINEGFIMMQESVYTKIVLNNTSMNLVKKRIYKQKPKRGLVQLLAITERQFSSIEYVVGAHEKEIVDTNKRMVIL